MSTSNWPKSTKY